MRSMWTRRTALAAGIALLGVVGSGCSRGPSPDDPPVPQLPSDWKIVSDQIVDRHKVYEIESRLEGRVKTARATLCQAGEHKIQVTTVVATESSEADKMYRILANRKPAYAYARKGDVLFEFVASVDAQEQVKRGRAAIAP